VSIRAIGGDPIWLLPLLQDPVAGVKASTAEVLGDIGISDSVVISELLKLLADEDPVVGNMSKMNDVQVLPALLEVIKQDLPGRWNGAIALGYLGNETAVDALMGLLQDPEIRVRECEIEALGKIGSRRSLEPVVA
jgi:HEAT repeat protein